MSNARKPSHGSTFPSRRPAGKVRRWWRQAKHWLGIE